LTAPKPTTPGKTDWKDLLSDKKVLVGAGAGVLFVIILLAFMLRKPKPAAVNAHLQEKPAISSGETKAQPATSLSPSRAVEAAESKASPNQADDRELEEVMPSFQLPAMTNRTKALLEHLRGTIRKDPQNAANVIRGWMEEV
jgi:flagellar biosynthesis/type III secretory pathway M-ring protein FliF/YscJ